MNFTQALSAVFNDGDAITRPIWHSGARAALDDGRLCINGFLDDKTGKWVNDGQWRVWFVTEQDYFADDWEVVE